MERGAGRRALEDVLLACVRGNKGGRRGGKALAMMDEEELEKEGRSGGNWLRHDVLRAEDS